MMKNLYTLQYSDIEMQGQMLPTAYDKLIRHMTSQLDPTA